MGYSATEQSGVSLRVTKLSVAEPWSESESAGLRHAAQISAATCATDARLGHFLAPPAAGCFAQRRQLLPHLAINL